MSDKFQLKCCEWFSNYIEDVEEYDSIIHYLFIFLSTEMQLNIVICYSLELKCSLKAHVLNT